MYIRLGIFLQMWEVVDLKLHAFRHFDWILNHFAWTNTKHLNHIEKTTPFLQNPTLGGSPTPQSPNEKATATTKTKHEKHELQITHLGQSAKSM